MRDHGKDVLLCRLARIASQGRPREIGLPALVKALDRLTRCGGLQDVAREAGLSVPDLLATFQQKGYTPHALVEAYLEYPAALAREAQRDAWREEGSAVLPVRH